MPVLTVLNHGTSNSSKGDKTLVITKLESLLGGKSGEADWMINQGAGSGQLLADRWKAGDWGVPGWHTVGGIVWGKGVDENVEKTFKWVSGKIGKNNAGTFTVNMAGHSRGSITCFKIANRLHREKETTGCKVNIFAIDPVAGNLGMINSGVYKDIVLQSNITSAYMFLAETERRTGFRPYIDKKFLAGLPGHRMDTIPGNHGGINELKATKRHESGDVVLHHAISFLHKNGTRFADTDELSTRLKSDKELMVLYATIMDHFMEYKEQGKGLGNFIIGAGLSKKGRVWNMEKIDRQPHGLKLEMDNFKGRKSENVRYGTGLGRRPRPSRFFANWNHEDLFQAYYGSTHDLLMQAQTLEGDDLASKVWEMAESDNCIADMDAMEPRVAANLRVWMSVAVSPLPK